MEKNKYNKYLNKPQTGKKSGKNEIQMTTHKINESEKLSKQSNDMQAQSYKSNYDSNSLDKINHSIYGMDPNEFERHIKFICFKIESVEFSGNHKKIGIVEKYEETERELIEYINNKDNSFNINQKKFFKLYIRQRLHEKFLSKDSAKRKLLEQKINETLHKFLSELDETADLKLLHGNQFSISNLNVELKEIENLAYLLKATENSYMTEFKSLLCSELNIDAIPNFLFHSNKKLIKQKVRKIWKINYEIPVNNMKLETKFGYKFLNEKFLDLINERFNIFDSRFLLIEERILLLKILFLTNINYLKINQYNLQAFLDNYRKYIHLMEISKFHKDIIPYITFYLDCKKDDEFYMTELNSLYEKLKKFLVNDFTILNEQINKEKILIIIFSFSIMLNNLMTFVSDSIPGCDESYKVVFCSELKISSRERQFMINLFKSLDYNLINYENDSGKYQFSCLDINYMLENSIFSSLIKSYTLVLFDELNKTKLILNHSEIFDIFKKHCENGDNTEMMIIYDNFNKFINDEVIFDDKQINIKKISQEITTKLKFFFTNIKKKLSNSKETNELEIKTKSPENRKKRKIDLSNLKFFPFDPINISTHICISINGHILEGEIEKMWNNFTINEKSVDHYFFHWIENIVDDKGFFSEGIWQIKKIQTGFTDEEMRENNNKQIFRKNKANSKIFGKILAYLIASRAIFRFHTISLIGYSLGCHVIKHCILELNKIFDYHMEINEIIQNVVFVAGATKLCNKKFKFKEIFKIISGRIVNCFSRYDKKLAEIYSKDAIGLKELPNENNEYLVENYDFSHLKLNHDDYIRELPTILNHINIL